MDILINELSLTGQFDSVEQFVTNALHPLISLLNEVDYSHDLLYKRYDFYNTSVTKTNTIHDVLIGSISRQYDEIRKFKIRISHLFDNPYWEDNRRHSSTCKYLYNGKNVCEQSIAEACERDKIIISFIHPDFSLTELPIIKESEKIVLDNLVNQSHYFSIAKKRGIKVQFSLKDTTCFIKTSYIVQGKPVYKEKNTNCYWYLDNFHKTHFEVFDSNGVHIGIADLNGVVNTNKRNAAKQIDL